MFVWPNGSTKQPLISSPYGYSAGYGDEFHYGLDTYGYTYNCAIGDGEITKIAWSTFGGGGREIYLTLTNGDVAPYYHNANSVMVTVGEKVKAGDRLALQSNTGGNYGIHCHLEIWVGGSRSRRTDPYAYLKARVGPKTASSGTVSTIEEAEEEEEEMKPFTIGIKNKNGTTQWALISGDLAHFVPIWTVATINEFGEKNGTWVTYVARDEWNGFRASAGLPADELVG